MQALLLLFFLKPLKLFFFFLPVEGFEFGSQEKTTFFSVICFLIIQVSSNKKEPKFRRELKINVYGQSEEKIWGEKLF